MLRSPRGVMDVPVNVKVGASEQAIGGMVGKGNPSIGQSFTRPREAITHIPEGAFGIVVAHN